MSSHGSQTPWMNVTERCDAFVIGAGVSGLTTALLLRERGVKNVTCLAESFDELTSHGAGALWEANPYGCGMDPDEAFAWASASYDRFHQLLPANKTGSSTSEARTEECGDRGAFEGETGVSKIKVVYALRHPSNHTILDCERAMEGFEEGTAVLDRYYPTVRHKERYWSAYAYDTLMIDMSRYMPWLLDQCRRKGVQMVTKSLPLLRDATRYAVEHTTKGRFAVIFNCTGLAAAWFLRKSAFDPPADRQLLPTFGQYFLLETDEIKAAITDGFSDKGTLAYLLPRGTGQVVCGGLSLPVPLEQLPIFQVKPKPEISYRVWKTCKEAVPAVERARVIKQWAGLRPYRKGGARVEAEKATDVEGRYVVVCHNYGHGGSGITLSFGTAQEAIEKALAEVAKQELSILQASETKGPRRPVPLRARL